MLQSLPSRCAVLFGYGLADFVFTSPVSVDKKAKWLKPNTFESEIAETSNKQTSFSESLIDVD